MILADTGVWVDFFNGKKTIQSDTLNQCLSDTIVVMGDLILAELLSGFHEEEDYRTAKSLLDDLERVELCNRELAIRTAKNIRILRKKGIVVGKTINSIIATYCIRHHIALLYSDPDFEPFVEHLNLRNGSLPGE
uniref:PIN domain-containing protein n=1 Tax=Candidatus Kentrum sp. DK TaxID=2126562 RepID=A0A450S6N4_9GAMM|nr:MAG: hypothetical protein BECKDK2373C_GA0170839_101840 [Candidatus Kentron sp. DK]VFJ63480.1 MAG: hypothetical protein BECKDK2373B_GA0170837_112612 [Candidatus Kentron sp. DK]